MKPKKPDSSLVSRSLYEPPRLVRVVVQTSRDHLQWQYAGQTTCTNHNHSIGDAGCAFPQ